MAIQIATRPKYSDTVTGARLTLQGDDNYFLEDDHLIIANTAVASLCMTALLIAALILLWRTTHVCRDGLLWWPRQARIFAFASLQLVLQLVNATFYLAPNAYYLAKQECAWFLLPISVFGFVRWSCWAAVSCCA